MGMISDVQRTMNQDAAIKFIDWVAKEEGISFQEAQELCITEPKYSLGLKLSDPTVRQALNKGSPLKRKLARSKIAEQLEGEELKLFLEMDMNEQTKEYKTELKKQKREAKKKKKSGANWKDGI